MLGRERIAIGLGSNLGDRHVFLMKAVSELFEEFLEYPSASLIYETEPWGISEQPKFLNAVVVGESEWKPPAIVNYLKELERRLGRTQSVQYGPREIDLDLLVYGDKFWDSEGVAVPHPRMEERDFVLVPLKDVWPTWVHPVTNQTVDQMISNLRSQGPLSARALGPLLPSESGLLSVTIPPK